jgi:hypothetical protein
LTLSRSSDPDTAEAAALKWQRRADAYRKRLQAIGHSMPASVRTLVRRATLHDASLLSINQARAGGHRQIFLSFRLPEAASTPGLQLRYDLVRPVKIVFHEGEAREGTPLFVLYDEFDLSARDAYTHSVLLSGGVEMRVKFTQLLMTHFTQVLAPGLDTSDIAGLTELAAS